MIRLLTISILPIAIFCGRVFISQNISNSNPDFAAGAVEILDQISARKISLEGNMPNDKHEDSVIAPVSPKENSTVLVEADPLKAGDISPDAKYIDADVLGDFVYGVAILKKGNAYAMINKQGEFILPYTMDYTIDKPAGEGMFSARTNQGGMSKYGIMNTKGKFIANPTDRTIVDFAGKYTLVGRPTYTKENSPFIYMDKEGATFTITGMYVDLLDDIAIVGTQGKRGFKNIKNQFIVKPIYQYAEHFKEGLAMVGNPDQFGVMKYGFVDKAGKEVIPLMFSSKPSPFSNGLAKVAPKDKTEFEYAFIDQKGSVVIKHSLEDVRKHMGHFGEFLNGYSFNGKYVMDTSGKISTNAEFLASFGITDKRANVEFRRTQTPEKIMYSNFGKVSRPSGEFESKMFGFIDLSKNKVVDACFYYDGKFDLKFDPVSKLSYAKVFLGQDAKVAAIIREGYVNEDGIFVLVKGTPASKW